MTEQTTPVEPAAATVNAFNQLPAEKGLTYYIFDRFGWRDASRSHWPAP